MRRRLFVLLLTCCALLATAQAQNTAQYAGKVLIQRQFVSGPHPVYDAEGKVLSGVIGPWTTSGEIQVTSVRENGEMLLIEGQRRLLLFDSSTKQFRDVFDLLKNAPDAARLFPVIPEDKQLQQLRDEQPVIIEVRRAAGVWDDVTAAAAMERVFLTPQENLSDVAPEIWKDLLCRMETAEGRIAPCITRPQPGPSYKVGGGVTAPRAVLTGNPEYNDLARKARFQGTTVLWIVVNREGRVANIKIARPIGLGLDEKAADAVRRWEFAPATKDGQPVNVQINVEVNFRLY